MKYLVEAIEKQHKVIEAFKEKWNNDKDQFDDELKVKSWFYEVSIYMTYHFYTEEYFISRDNDRDKIHRSSHKQLMAQFFSVLMFEGTLSKLKQMVSNYFDKYLEGHMRMFDSRIKYEFTDKNANYFMPDDYHGGFILLFFRKGYFAISFGTMTDRVVKTYNMDFSIFEDGWTKFVDLSRWQYQTQEAVEPSIAINNLEIENRRGHSYVVVRDKISEFSVGQWLSEDKNQVTYLELSELLSNEDLVDLVTSELLEIRVVASKSYIDGYFEEVLKNQ